MAVTLPRYDHIVIVALENHGYGQIVGSSSAPYINNTLIKGGVLFSDYHGIGHPSFPNYLALWCGKEPVSTDSCPPAGAPYSLSNLNTALTAAKASFGGWLEYYPGKPTACGPSPYAGRHVPYPWFQTAPPASASQDWSKFPQSSAGWAGLPQFNWVSPGLNHDMHSYSGISDVVKSSDDWLAANIDGYAQWAKAHNSLLILWWDEDNFTTADHCPMVFYGANLKDGTINAGTYNHYDLLATLCAHYGQPGMGAAASGTVISGCWNTTGPPPPPPALQITTTSLAAATKGQAYSQVLAATGGATPYRWGQPPGLPAGMSVDPASGTLAGTPTTAGSYPFEATVTDANGATASQPLTLTVQDVTPPPAKVTITTTSLPQENAGQQFSVPIVASGGATPYRWAVAGNLPPGVSLDAATGMLAGSADTPGSYPFTADVTDAAGQTASQPLTLTIVSSGPPPPPPPPPASGALLIGAGALTTQHASDAYEDTYTDLYGVVVAPAATPPAPAPAWTQLADAYQTGWGGVVFSNRASPYTSIEATFTVPDLSGDAGSLCSVWVGLGNVHQVGIYLSYDTGKPGNANAGSAWMWFLPAGELWNAGFTPAAGDSLTLAISYDDDYWYASLTNNTTGVSYEIKKGHQAAGVGGLDGGGEWMYPHDTAEVIVEKEGSSDLPNYGTLTFDSIKLGPVHGGQWRRLLTRYSSQVNQEPGLFDGSSFTLTWEAYA